ncbi:MAG: hypothetical protein LBH84_07460 [Prevotellaceae bacterium]|nr:hypothetical protein [Prevotellaceae bacterium]
MTTRSALSDRNPKFADLAVSMTSQKNPATGGAGFFYDSILFSANTNSLNPAMRALIVVKESVKSL